MTWSVPCRVISQSSRAIHAVFVLRFRSGYEIRLSIHRATCVSLGATLVLRLEMAFKISGMVKPNSNFIECRFLADCLCMPSYVS